jgi:outer membrane protein W
MRKVLLAFLVASACAPAVATAEQGDWVVRLRVANINPDEGQQSPSYGRRHDVDRRFDCRQQYHS